jgi:putative FmdB family regulatory protein
MPIYEYRCEKGHEFEVIQRMSDDPVTKCEECGAPVERVFNPVAVHFKGSGFYTTDYARSSKGGQGSGKDSDSGSAKSESKSEKSGKKDSKKAGKESSSGGGKAKTS